MSEQTEPQVEQPATEETPQETPAAEETPAKTEEQAEAKPEDTAAKEGEGAAAAEEPKKKEEPPKPAAPPKPAPEYHAVKSGYIQRQGLLFKKWTRQWMTLDEEGAALRWYRDESRAGNDGTLYMNVCADVCDPKEGVTTTWPEGVAEDCRFVVCSPNRAFYMVAESAEEKNEWVAKLTEAKNKFNTKGAKIISLDLFSVEAIKVALTSESDRAQADTDKTLAEHGTSTEEVGKSLDKAAKDAESELKKDEGAQQVVKETEQAAQQVEAEVKGEGEGGATAEVTVQAEVEGQKEEPTPAEEGERKEE